MALDPDTARRLAYVRYLHHLGVTQAAFPEPQSYPSLMLLHDAVESMLIVVADSYGVSSPDFLKYWKALEPHVKLTGFRGMDRLNRARNGLKHNGVPPSVSAITLAVSDTATFMEATTQAAFGLDYADISMVDAVPQPEVRDLLRAAERLHAQGETTRAMFRVTDAFDALFAQDRRRTQRDSPRALPFWKTAEGPMVSPSDTKVADVLLAGIDTTRQGNSRFRGRVSDWDAQDVAKMITSSQTEVHALRAALQVVALGIDFNAYERFRVITPGRPEWSEKPEYFVPDGYPPPDEDFRFAVDFMVTASIKLGVAQSHRMLPSWMVVDQFGRIQRTRIEDTP